MKKSEPLLIDWKTKGTKIVFFDAAGGAELFAMAGERFGFLLNAEYVKGQLRDATEERAWPEAWGLKEFVEASRFLRKQLSMNQVAKLWEAPEPTVRAFYSNALQRFGHDVAVRQEESRQAAEGRDYCQSTRRAEGRPGEDPRPAETFLEIPMVIRLLKEFGTATAVELNLDPADFKKWVEANQKYLDLF